MDAMDKIKKSAEALGVLLQIPAFVDPMYGFMNEKVIKWENGDQIKVTVIWAEGVFNYTAVLGQIDPQTNELAFVSGPIAEAQSLETLIDKINAFIVAHAEERKPEEEPVEVVPPVEVDEIPAEPVDIEVPADAIDEPGDLADLPADSIPDVVNDYQALNQEYQQLLLDPDHDHLSVWEMSEKLKGLEYKLREQGIKPGDLLV